MAQHQRDSKMIPAAQPATQARDQLGIALGQIQEVPNPSSSLQTAVQLIANALNALFSVQSSHPDDPTHVEGVQNAMSSLSNCLEKLQEASIQHPSIDAATSTIARTLALLYPISKSQEKGPLPSNPPPPKVTTPFPRRIKQRAVMETDVGFQSESHFYTGFTQNISEGGLFLATYDVQELGTEIAVSFTLPDGHLVNSTGIVKWLREYNDANPDLHPGMGLQFKDLTENDRVAIENFLKVRPPIFFED